MCVFYRSIPTLIIVDIKNTLVVLFGCLISNNMEGVSLSFPLRKGTLYCQLMITTNRKFCKMLRTVKKDLGDPKR
jgi:hypothetical protein